jgi:hypothetical protein
MVVHGKAAKLDFRITLQPSAGSVLTQSLTTLLDTRRCRQTFTSVILF